MERHDNPWKLSKDEVILYNDIFPKTEEKEDTTKVNSTSYIYLFTSFHGVSLHSSSHLSSSLLYNNVLNSPPPPSLQVNIFQLHLDDFVWKHINSCFTIGAHFVSYLSLFDMLHLFFFVSFHIFHLFFSLYFLKVVNGVLSRWRTSPNSTKP